MADKRLRDAPSYQEYASDLLANRHYALMTLSERGLFDIMRKECWVNKSVPSNKADLARIVGCSIADVEENLSSHVLHFFIEKDDQYFSPELDDYRYNQEERRRKISEGGKKGGEITQAKNKGRLKGTLKALSRDELNGDEQRREEIESLESDVINNSLSIEHREFVEEMNQAEALLGASA